MSQSSSTTESVIMSDFCHLCATFNIYGPKVLYITDLPMSIHTTGTFADDTVILARHDDPVTASHKLQGHLDQLEAWLKKVVNQH
jgi:hypothetical protein